MHLAVGIVALIVVAASVAGLAERFGASPPLLLVLVGVAGSFIPGIPTVVLDPEVVLLGLLPPLLYSAALSTSLFDIRRNWQSILLLAFGLVVFTTFVVGLITWWLVPAVSLAAALALGAVVAPPDAVAASAVARRVGMPRRAVSILESESLLNDATALVALNVAVLAIDGSIGIREITGRFLLASVGGVLIGVAVAVGLAQVRRRIDRTVLDTSLSFVAPYVAFLPAEALHSSGVVSVVVAGLILAHRAPVLQSAASRISEATNWKTIQFLLENVVFLLIGLELRDILHALSGGGDSVGTIVALCAGVLLACVCARFAWVFLWCMLYRYGPRALRQHAWSFSAATVISWCGMRGVVTLAAVLVLPDSIAQLPLLKLAAFTTVVGTLLIQGLSLPWLVRALGLRGPDAAEDALHAASLITQATAAGLERLDALATSEDPPEVLAQLRDRADRRSNQAWERLGRGRAEYETPSATYRRLRLQMLAAERESIIAARDSGQVDYPVLQAALTAVDVEESLLDRGIEQAAQIREELVSGLPGQDCAHLIEAAQSRVDLPATPRVCGDCLAEGTSWVHLRMCLNCGNVACCDSSEGKHAQRHFRRTEHPVMRSAEPGEAWRWCYVHEQLG